VLRGVADVDEGGSRGEAAHRRQRQRAGQRRGLERVLARLRQAADTGHADLFPSDPERQPRHQVGYEYIFNHYRQAINGQSGAIQYLPRNGQTDQIQLADVGTFADLGNGWQPGYDDNTMFSIFAQDRWSPAAKLTLTFGARFGHQRPHYEQGTRNPILADVFPKMTVPERTILSRSNIAPRIGLAYDLFGNGKTAVKLFYGRYYAIYANNFTALNPGGANYRTYRFLDQNHNGVYDGPGELARSSRQAAAAARRSTRT